MNQSRNKNLSGAAIIVMSSIVISRITGFLRDTLIVNMIPSKIQKDALLMSFTITDLLYFLLVGGAISAAIIPILSGYLAKDKEEEGWKAVSSFINIVFVLMTIFSILGIIFAPQLIDRIAPGFDGTTTKEIAIRLIRIMFPSVSFLMLAGLANGVLNSYQRFAAAAYGPIIYNVGSILSILFLSRYGVEKVALGIMLSAMIYLIFQLSFSMRNLKYYKPKVFLQDPGFKRLFGLAIPSLIASSITQVNVVISSSFTTWFAEGSVTALRNATNIWQLPYGIFAMGMGMAILPAMSERIALQDHESFKALFIKSLKTVLLLILPSATAFIILGGPIVSAIYKWSPRFDSAALQTTSNILLFYTIALISQSIYAIISRVYYANQDTKTPLYVGMITIIINIILCNLLFRYTSLEAPGMALAYSISSFINVIILMLLLEKKVKIVSFKKMSSFLIKTVLACIVMAVALYFIHKITAIDIFTTFTLSYKIKELVFLGIEILIGFIIYAGIVLLFRIEEAVNIYRIAVQKIFQIFFRK